MLEKDFLYKILDEHSALPKLSASEQFAALLDVPKQPNLTDQLAGLKNRQPNKPVFDDKEQRKEQIREEPKNPKYTLTNKNISKLIDKTDEHDSKIEILCFKLADMGMVKRASRDRKNKGELLSHSVDSYTKFHY